MKKKLKRRKEFVRLARCSSDPLEIARQSIPEGMAYQWFARSIMGVLQPEQFAYRTKGWRAVPPRRHPDLPSHDGRIEHEGLVLMERSAAKVEAAHAKNLAQAKEMIKDAEGAYGYHGGHALVPARSSPLLAVSAASAILRPIPPPGTIKEMAIQLPIKILLSEREVDAAYWCALSPVDYARAKLGQMIDGGYPESFAAALAPARDGCLRFAGLTIRMEPWTGKS